VSKARTKNPWVLSKDSTIFSKKLTKTNLGGLYLKLYGIKGPLTLIFQNTHTQ
jgi:hypothetical protein